MDGTRNVLLPVLEAPLEPAAESDLRPGGWWHAEGDRIVCDVCPRKCSLKAGDRGFCFVRQNLGNRMMLTTYGRSTGFCIDPIEKKPLNHFLPGTSVLSFGTAGCNLGCKFCQNWDISKSREIEKLSQLALPDQIAHAAKSLGCHSVAFTYNDPVIWAEYAIDTARACRELGIKAVAVTAGYITPECRGSFYEFMDAANVDLKAFTEEFYHHVTLSHLAPVLETLKWLKAETDVWFEITNLVIPGENDREDEFRQMCDWILDNVGDEVPVHFTAFHPDFRMLDRPNTPPETLVAARDIALQTGLKYVYVGNVNDVARQSTYCPNCRRMVIERDWYALVKYALNGDRCAHCGHAIAGRFLAKPGDWGRRRLPVDISKYVSRNVTANRSVDLNPRESSGAPPARVEPIPRYGTGGTMESAIERAVAMPNGATTSLAALPTPLGEPTEDEKQALHTAAAEIIKAAALGRQPRLSDPSIGDTADRTCWGIFVSLKRKGHLRSCCGSFGQSMTMRDVLHDAAVRTATNDPRFPAVSPSELPHLDLEVWLLHEPERVAVRGEERVAEVTVGLHGLQVVRGQNRSLLLPGVAVEHEWEAEEFLHRVCMKAGLPPSAWKEDATTVIRFRGDAHRGRLADVPGIVNGRRSVDFNPHVSATAANGVPRVDSNPHDGEFDDLSRTLFQRTELNAYADYCRETLSGLLSGMTVTPYFTAAADANVSGVAVSASNASSDLNSMLWRLSIRGQMPLQTTLYSLCEELAGTLKKRGARTADSAGLRIDVAIFHDPAMHGTVGDPDLDGIGPTERCVVVRERARTGWSFDANGPPSSLLERAAETAQVTEPEAASIFSFAYVSTTARLAGGAAPRPIAGPEIRPAAVAGRFYPSDPVQVSQMVDSLIGERVPREKWAAALVPHAGWKFSGRLAADVLKRIEFPGNAIVIGPKHTPHGVEWAVAPHLIWGLPNGNTGSNQKLARELAAAIPGLQLDAAAHQQEHAVEVELPFIARLSPKTRVVGIAMSGGPLRRCEQFADGLAEVLSRQSERPLLIVSSDMNHYAGDAETRRLDALALAQLNALDADGLYETCTEHHISMCGLLPAVIVLKALQRLRALHECRPIGYATSADVTGDAGRVVGYAGMLIR